MIFRTKVKNIPTSLTRGRLKLKKFFTDIYFSFILIIVKLSESFLKNHMEGLLFFYLPFLTQLFNKI